MGSRGSQRAVALRSICPRLARQQYESFVAEYTQGIHALVQHSARHPRRLTLPECSPVARGILVIGDIFVGQSGRLQYAPTKIVR